MSEKSTKDLKLDIHYLREHYERWETIFELAPVGISIADGSGKIIKANTAAEQILGLSSEQYLAKRIDDDDWHIFDEHGRAIPPENFPSTRALREQKIIEHEVMQVVTRTRATWITVSAAPLPTGGVIIVYADISELKHQQEKIEFLLEHDQLTGIANRVAFFKVLNGFIENAQRDACEVAVVLLDIDSFKEFNEAAGHEVGDTILCEVARRIRDYAPDESFVARIGGDEFAIVCTHFGNDLLSRAGRYLAKVAEPIFVNDAEFRLEVKAGLSALPAATAQSDLLWRQADIAMHEAKSRKAALVFYHDTLAEKSIRRFEVTERLRKALSNKDIQFALQPQYTSDGRFIGAEVLARWHDAILGTVSPSEFIPLAEERGLICRVTESILEQLLEHMQEWRRQGVLGSTTFAVNLSVRDLERDDLPKWLATTVAEAGFGAERFELEVTETALMVHPDDALVTLKKLQKHGFTIAIDDFGTGHSSLNYLKIMEAERLKIDMSFTDAMLDSRVDHGIVKTIISMASIFGMKTLAEGVESESQLTELRRLGCDYVQGYYFAKPMSVADFSEFLAEQKIKDSS